MWLCRKYCNTRNRRFFRISLCHDSLQNHYVTNFQLMQHHKYDLTVLDNMLPFEREIYIGLLKDHIEQENERIRKENAKMKR